MVEKLYIKSGDKEHLVVKKELMNYLGLSDWIKVRFDLSKHPFEHHVARPMTHKVGKSYLLTKIVKPGVQSSTPPVLSDQCYSAVITRAEAVEYGKLTEEVKGNLKKWYPHIHFPNDYQVGRLIITPLAPLEGPVKAFLMPEAVSTED